MEHQQKDLSRLLVFQLKEDFKNNEAEKVKELLSLLIKGEEPVTTSFFEYLSDNLKEIFFSTHPDHTYFRPLDNE